MEFNNEALGLRLGPLEIGFNEELGLGKGFNDANVLVLVILPILLLLLFWFLAVSVLPLVVVFAVKRPVYKNNSANTVMIPMKVGIKLE